MSLLGRMKGDSGGRLSVGCLPPDPGPGAELTVTAQIHEQPDDKTRALLVGVRCVGSYKVTERSRDSDGDYEESQVSRTITLHEEERRCLLQPEPHRLVFDLPADARASSADVVHWEAYARLDRERGIDVVQCEEFPVRVPRERIPDTRTQDASQEGFTLSGVPSVVAQGEVVKGWFGAHVAVPVSARSIRVRVHRRISYLADPINDYDLYQGSLGFLSPKTRQIVTSDQVADLEVGGPGTLNPGPPTWFPFAVQIPPAGPTTSHAYAQVDWRVEGLVDRRLQGDLGVESPLIVV